MNAAKVDTQPSCCTLCGRPEVDMDSWLGICHDCLTQAVSIAAAEEGQTKETDLPNITGYRMRRLIGCGGMGSVYEAVRETDDRRVALKLIVPEMATQARFREQFHREGEALRVLDHPGVVRRLDSGEENGLPWLAMEFIDGPDLRQVMRRGPLQVARALEIAAETGAALAAAHTAHIVHRDIKPANVLLDPEGRVKVADFGMARPHGKDNPASDPLTLVAAAAGHYSAPELERKGAGDERADIYSLGALLHHLLTGHAPRANYRPARKERPGAGISSGVDRIIARCLQTDPDRRYRTMKEVLAELERERERLKGRAGGKRGSLWLGPAVVAGMALGFILLPRFGPTKATADDPESQITSRLAKPPAEWESRTMINTLGMPFVSIPGCEVLFCAWETRVQDYAAFGEPWPDQEDSWVKETGFAFPLKKPVFSLHQGEFKAAGKSWRDPGFPSGADHAVCGISASDAMAFCTWLTWKERQEGKIRADQAYRLPTDEEWSAAAGLAAEPGATPEERAASWPAGVFVHLWSPSWPAPDAIHNVAGDEVDDWDDWHPGWLHSSRRDPWRGTAPVTATPPSPFGLHHLTGNVWEWTETPYNQTNETHTFVLRGGSWQDTSREGLSLAFRDRDAGTMRMTKRGFRIVFQESSATGWSYSGKR